ncbi:acetamidase/formamidase family protein [Paenisporosarcina macmurdoensis]|uniref:Acetamidase/formamidase family protein n=1 Tax=Paenisporosarcina macmurdoensis TaxID=212659 RepID=A0ABW1LAZ5_9BACL
MKTISRDVGIIYEFNETNQPIATVASGSMVRIETYDCFKNQIDSEDMELTNLDWDQINPATGPIFVEDAKPGDVLKVKIHSIEIDSQGVMLVGPNLGIMGHQIEKMSVKILPIENEKVLFNDLQLPINKMIGVIGVAPFGQGVNCGTPGAHGGNMDNKMVTEGATLYFPVAVEGALFGLGDFHAAMGDGEVSVSGVEVAGAAIVTLEVMKGQHLEQPMLENDESFTQIASAMTLDEASKMATQLMINRLVERTDMNVSEVTMLMSAVGQLEICQVVDPLVTVRFVVPKWLLSQLNATLIG